MSVGNLASAMSCAWLVRKLHRLDSRLRQRLFARQLMSLAIADILFHLAFFCGSTLDFAPDYLGSGMQDKCTFILVAFSTLRIISVLNEINMAVSLMLQALKVTTFQPYLAKGIPFAWFIGVCFVLPLQVFRTRWHWSSDKHLCLATAQDETTVVTLFVSVGVCLVAYLIVFGRALCMSAPDSVQRVYFRRVAFYPLNFVLTYALIMPAYVAPALFEDGVYFYVAVTCETFGGLLNVLTYASQARYLMPKQQSRPFVSAQACTIAPAEHLTFHVDIGGSEVINVESLSVDSLSVDSLSLDSES